MSFDWAEAKAQLRRTVHDTFGVAAIYRAPNSTVDVPLRVRLHTKIGVVETDQNTAFIEGVTRLVFDRVFLRAAAPPIQPMRGGNVTLTVYGMSFTLENEEPITGPVDLAWNVVQLGKTEE